MQNERDETLRAALRRREEREAKLQALRHALADGENSGPPAPVNTKDFLKSMHAKPAR